MVLDNLVTHRMGLKGFCHEEFKRKTNTTTVHYKERLTLNLKNQCQIIAV